MISFEYYPVFRSIKRNWGSILRLTFIKKCQRPNVDLTPNMTPNIYFLLKMSKAKRRLDPQYLLIARDHSDAIQTIKALSKDARAEIIENSNLVLCKPKR